MKKWFATGVMLFFALIGCNRSQPENNAIMVGMSGRYYPFTFSREDTLRGFEVDVWNEIGRRLERPVEFVLTNFSGLFGMLEAEKIDTISNQITITKERRKKYAFTIPYVYDGAQLVVREDNNSINGVADLCGKKVVVNLGSNFEQILNRLDTKKCMEIVSYDSGIEQDVVIGRAAAFMMDRNSAVALISESELPLKLAGGPVELLENALPFRKDKKGVALRDQVNRVLETMREDGTLGTISMRWFDVDITRAK